MFEILRRAAHTWIAKGLLLLLVVSFGIWGVAHSNLAGTSDTVITVGDQAVSTNEFRLAYQRQVADLSRQFGTQLTSEQARAFGIDQQVFAQLVAGAALDQLSTDMNLGLSEDRLATLIADDPAFKDVSGQFDRQLFASRLRNAGLREDDYIQERSKVAVRSQIVDAVSDGFAPPATLLAAMKQYRDESRSIDYLLLSNANIDPVKTPTDDVLAKWFDTVKARYRAPEFRKVAYVKLQPADIADEASVSDDAVAAEFEKRRDSFRTPESRRIEQLSFPDKEMADAAVDQLASGITFDQLVADQGKTAADVLLGDFAKDKVPDAAIAEAAFAIGKDGGTSPVVQGSFGPVILRVTNIKPETTKALEDVKADLRKELALAAAADDILNVHDRFEDLRASGVSLEEAAKELNLKPVVLDAVDASGLDKAGEQVKDLPASANLLSEAFKAEIGAETLPLNLDGDGYVWFEVQDIVPERDRSLEEVREKATADWTTEQQKAALAAKAEALKGELQKGGTLADIAASMGIAVETKSGLKRNSDDPVLGRAAVAAAFSGPVGAVASAATAEGSEQVLLKVAEVNEQATTDVLDNQEQQLQAIANAAGDDILDQMVNRLQGDYGVTINRTLAEQAMVR
ncbi:SurA N-terminal domain-containing protein [Rhizobiaceae bacterium n13]|uniref:peptidylprolyl isomerase n=1 Tax=Ferirhizobium litorale TaxID=2927786 RepID=UPI0024B2CE1A|nr:SurA N-terminal domain-containing protein [Fererhizobium litorale]MDI7864072.1 SurA N-terminal domain-containing protein [Fererhizobium litorale]